MDPGACLPCRPQHVADQAGSAGRRNHRRFHDQPVPENFGGNGKRNHPRCRARNTGWMRCPALTHRNKPAGPITPGSLVALEDAGSNVPCSKDSILPPSPRTTVRPAPTPFGWLSSPSHESAASSTTDSVNVTMPLIRGAPPNQRQSSKNSWTRCGPVPAVAPFAVPVQISAGHRHNNQPSAVSFRAFPKCHRIWRRDCGTSPCDPRS